VTADALERLAVEWERRANVQIRLLNDANDDVMASHLSGTAIVYRSCARELRTELAALHAADHDTPAPGGDHG
jgi:hypothetical protein